jgi:hypothetical protein
VKHSRFFDRDQGNSDFAGRCFRAAAAQDPTPVFAASSLHHVGLPATTSLNTTLEFDYALEDETRGFRQTN